MNQQINQLIEWLTEFLDAGEALGVRIDGTLENWEECAEKVRTFPRPSGLVVLTMMFCYDVRRQLLEGLTSAVINAGMRADYSERYGVDLPELQSEILNWIERYTSSNKMVSAPPMAIWIKEANV